MKRQAVAELQRAVAAAESKATELVVSERSKVERLVAEARKHAVEEAVAGNTERSDSPPTPSQTNVSPSDISSNRAGMPCVTSVFLVEVSHKHFILTLIFKCLCCIFKGIDYNDQLTLKNYWTYYELT